MRTDIPIVPMLPHPNPSAPQRLSGSHLAARVVDLCCGMGGLSVAAREMGMRVVAGVDGNPNALRTFSRNFPEAEAIEGSVRTGVRLSVFGVGRENAEGVRCLVVGDRENDG